jgi:Tfp pilus assembly protein PilN
MAQQINLYTPILLKERRYFSAQAMAVALGAFAAGLAVLGAVLAHQAGAVQAELEHSRTALQADRTRLAAALGPQRAASGAPGEAAAAALRQEAEALHGEIATLRERHAQLARGLVRDGHSHSALLRLVARTLPASAWLHDIRIEGPALTLEGRTLAPAALNPWLAALAGEPLLAGRPLTALRVAQQSAPPDGAAPTWQFTLVNGEAPATGAPARPGDAR